LSNTYPTKYKRNYGKSFAHAFFLFTLSYMYIALIRLKVPLKILKAFSKITTAIDSSTPLYYRKVLSVFNLDFKKPWK
jgi:hypothetical protein